MRPVLFDMPKIYYNTYMLTPRQTFIHDLVMKRMKGKRTGVQPYYHEKGLIIVQNGFSEIQSFENTGMQFEWFQFFQRSTEILT